MPEKLIIRGGRTLSVTETAEKYGATRFEVERLRELVLNGTSQSRPAAGKRSVARKAAGSTRKSAGSAKRAIGRRSIHPRSRSRKSSASSATSSRKR